MNVLELGSGTGFLGMTIARNARRDVGVVALTEMEAGGALEWLKKCVAKNEGKGLWRDGAVTCAALHPNQARPVIALVPIRPSWRGERRSLRTSPGDSLRPGSLGFDPDARAATPFDSA